jgi:hypothetical protein
VASLALASHFGLEIVAGSEKLTTWFDGRLALNTWIFNNPNSLGHAVAGLVPLTVAWMWHHRPISNRASVFIVLSIAGYCLLLTESKGAYIAVAASLSSLYVFRRPIWFQMLAASLVLSIGLSALAFLPRMETLSAKDQGIMGRMMVWQSAMWSLKTNPTGVGLKKFQGTIFNGVETVNLATHGSFVRTGADLGYPGLFLYLGLFYTGYRTLRLYRFTPKSDEFRIQSGVFVLLISYMVSCWVVDRAYHADFILLMALISAVHRIVFKPHQEQLEAEGRENSAPDQALALPGVLDAGGKAMVVNRTSLGAPTLRETALELKERAFTFWSALKLHDLGVMFLLLWLVVFAWDYLSTKFLPF